MRMLRYFIMIAPVLGSGVLCLALDGGVLVRIKQAVIRDQCGTFYWGKGDAKTHGRTWPLKVAVEGERFYARVEFGKGHSPTRSDYWGVYNDQRASIRGNYLRDFEEKLQHNPIDTTVTVPTDCTPKYDPPTPEKQRMLETLVRKMREDLSRDRDIGISDYPDEVTLVIANFNVDDLHTYVLVLQQRDVFRVSLHDPDWKDDAAYQERGGYISIDVADAAHRRALIPKIREQGIIREIHLEPRSIVPMHLEVTGGNETVLLTAEYPFGKGVECGPAPAEPRGTSYETPRPTWQAHCPGFDDCVTSVRYGDDSLFSEIPAQPLVAGPCYRCKVWGTKGWGRADFRLAPDGTVEACSARADTPERR